MPKLKNSISDIPFSVWPFEAEFHRAMIKKPPLEPFIRVGITACFEKGLYNFTLRTPTQQGSFVLVPLPGHMDLVWKFLENLCQGKMPASLLCENEGANALLTAQTVDNEQLRLTLMEDAWLEEFFNKKSRYWEFKERYWPAGKPQVALDTIVSKKYLIYAFHNALLDLFETDEGSYRQINMDCCPWMGDPQVDSEIVRAYLGYVPAGRLDKELLRALEDSSPSQVEKLLQQGANPNALVQSPSEDIPKTILECFWEQGIMSDAPTPNEQAIFLQKNELLARCEVWPQSPIDLFYSLSICPEEVLEKIFLLFFQKQLLIRASFWSFLRVDSEWENWAFGCRCVKKAEENKIFIGHRLSNGNVTRSDWHQKQEEID